VTELRADDCHNERFSSTNRPRPVHPFAAVRVLGRTDRTSATKSMDSES
jgi:hypothetical protein